MDNRCTVCTHASRAEIDRALMAGYSLRSLAAQYGVSASALSRHLKHLDRALAAGDTQEHQRHQAALLDQLDLLQARLDRIFRKAENLHSLHVSLGCIQESVRILGLRERLRLSSRGRA
jgi:IS30 family transposase